MNQIQRKVLLANFGVLGVVVVKLKGTWVICLDLSLKSYFFYIFHSKVMINYLSEQMATNVKELAQIAAGWTKLNFHVKYNWLINIILTPIVLIAYNCLQIPLYHLRSPDLTMWHTALPKGNQPRLNTVIFKNIIKTVSENVRNNDQSKKKNWLWLLNYLHWYTKPCN